MASASVTARLEYLWETPWSLWGRLSSVDHKVIGTRYLVRATALLRAHWSQLALRTGNAAAL
jgi:hypothetical protein